MCGKLLVAFSVTIVLPVLLVNLLIGGEALQRLLDSFRGKGLEVFIVIFSPMLINFFLPAIIAAILGAMMLIWSRRLRVDQASSTHVRRRCGYLMLGFLLISACVFLWPLLPIPWREFGFSNPEVSRLRDFTWHSLYGLFLMEGLFVVVHITAIFFLWCASLFFALGMISPQTNAEEFSGG